MISREQSLQTAECFIKSHVGNAVYGIQPAGKSLPVYRTRREGHGPPPVCAFSRSGGPTKARCEKFYRMLEGGSGTTRCPFGIELSYVRLPEKQLGGVSLFVQRGVHVSEKMKAYTARMPRKKKKAIESRVDQQARYRHTIPIGDPIQAFEEVVTTLSAGRAAETIAGIAHEMLTPVQGVMNDVEELRRTADGSDGQVLERLQRNIGSVKQLAKRVHLLLSSDVPLNHQMIRRVNLWQMVENVVEALRPHGEERDIDIQHNKERRVPRVQAIPDQLELVINALLHNAVKYSFRGTSERRNVVTIDYRIETGYVVVRVDNRGCFITKEEVDNRRIFEMNYRGLNSGDRNRSGTGTGLYVADRITTQHTGEISGTSEVVARTSTGDLVAKNTFELKWPMYQPEREDG